MSVTDNYGDARPVPTVRIHNVNMYFSSVMIRGGNIRLEWGEECWGGGNAQPSVPAATLVTPIKNGGAWPPLLGLSHIQIKR